MYINDNIYSLNTETSYPFDTTFEIIETRTLEDIIIKSENDFNNPNPKIFEIKKEKNKRKKAKTIPFLREIGLTNGKHTKNAKDNIFRRIKVHSFKFIIDFTNDYIKKIFRKRIVKFKKAACNQFVSDVTIGFNHILKKTTLSDILCRDNVNQNEKKNTNKKLIEFLIEKSKDFESFFSLTYEELYSFFLCDKIKKTELQKKYGLKKAVIMEEYIDNQVKLGYDDEEYACLFKKYARAFFYYLYPDNARNSNKTKNYKSCNQNKQFN